MTDALLHAYTPLILWIGIGLILFRFLPQSLPQVLGRGLYWVGVPIQIFTLSRQTDFSAAVGLAPVATGVALGTGFGLAGLYLWWANSRFVRASTVSIQQEDLQPSDLGSSLTERSYQGSFLLASTLGNTGFVGLSIVPSLIDPASLGWAVFYTITHNVVGSYGVGVLAASYFGRSVGQQVGWKQLRDVVSAPALWAFAAGYLTQSISLPATVEAGLRSALWLVIPCALLLMGIRLGQLFTNSLNPSSTSSEAPTSLSPSLAQFDNKLMLKAFWQNLKAALIPTCIRILFVPGLIGLGITLLNGLSQIEISGDARLAMVLMSGMPSAFANLILSEEYGLNRNLMVSSIVLTTVGLLLTIPLWLYLFQ